MSYYLRNGSYYVVYRPDGRYGRVIHSKCPPGVTEEQAKAIDESFKAVNRQRRKEMTPQVEGDTISELWPQYEAWTRLDRKHSTQVDIEIAGLHICRILGAYAVKHLNHAHITLFKTVRLRDPGRSKGSRISNRTVNKELSWFSGFLHYLRKNAIEVPRIEIEMLKYHAPVPVILTPQEALGIINNLPYPEYKGFVACLYFLGLRLSEVRRLKKGDMQDGLLYVHDTKSGVPKIMAMPEILKAILSELPPSDSPFLFPSRLGTGPIIDIRGALKRAAKGITTKKVGPHLMRHSITSHLNELGVNTANLMSFLGHSQLNTTQRYIQHLSSSKQNIADTTDGLFANDFTP